MGYQIVLASHGSLAEGMESAVKMISGDHDNLHSYGLDKWKTPQAIDMEIENLSKQYSEDRLLILCDIKGGSVHNKLVERCVKNNAIVISGMNLGLVLDLVLSASCLDEEKIQDKIIQASKSIVYFDHYSFEKEEKGEDSLW